MGMDRGRLLHETLKEYEKKMPKDKWAKQPESKIFVEEYMAYHAILEPYYQTINNPATSTAEKERALREAATAIRQHLKNGPKAPVAEEIEPGSPAAHLVLIARQPIASPAFTHGRLAALIALRALGYKPTSKPYKILVGITARRNLGETVRRLQLTINERYAAGKKYRKAQRSKERIEGYEENPQQAMELAFQQAVGTVRATLQASRFKRYYQIVFNALERKAPGALT
ncbi:MAG: hypothetical protein IPJ89_00710 [Candidatus Iainarchaeum archaeon]|uniref:Uncharacterized protein n=1 Tax=Candidatus Iainarchaeum sp. TaxID=3101447 RepID=A0A7T9I1T3_9ARCH|nr:MAG: hypothetical protein IPJ89_00710 [Candidatus Diapherotrites archaeon]